MDLKKKLEEILDEEAIVKAMAEEEVIISLKGRGLLTPDKFYVIVKLFGKRYYALGPYNSEDAAVKASDEIDEILDYLKYSYSGSWVL